MAISHKEAFGRVGGSFVKDPVWRPPRNWSALTFLSWPPTAPASHILIADAAKVRSSRSVIVCQNHQASFPASHSRRGKSDISYCL